MTAERKRTLFAVVLIAVVTAISFSPTLQNGFTNWDDNHMVTDNLMIRSMSIANIVRIFGSMHYGHYHPLVVLSYAAEFHFFRLDPWIYHFTNLIFHVLNSLLVFWFIRGLRGGLYVPLVTALVFAVHPLHVESVAWVTERKDMLYTFFYLLSLISYVQYVRSGKNKFFYYAFAAFFCSLLCKAMAVTLPLVLLIVDYLLRRKYDRILIIEKFPWVAVSFFFSIIMLYATYQDKSQVESASFALDNILVAFHGVLFYIVKFVYPVSLSSLYPYPGRITEPLPLEYTLPPYIVLLLAILLILSMRKSRLPFFCAMFFVLTASPVLQLTRIGGVIAADRFVYVPVLGLILGLVEGVKWLIDKKIGWSTTSKWLTVAACSAVVAFLSYQTFNRTKVWKGSVTLWDNVISQYRGLPVAYNNRGLAFADRQEFKKALDDYNAGLSLDDRDWKLWYNRGNALRELGTYQDAVDDYNHAIALFPTYPDTYYQRGLSYHSMNKVAEAIDDYSQAVRLDPGREEAYVNRGTIYAETKEYDKAMRDFNAALQLNPDDPDAYFDRGVLYRTLGKLDEAIVDFTQSILLQPVNAKTLNFRGMTYFSKGEFDRAVDDYERAIEILPTDANLFNNRGAAYYQKREFDKAIRDYTTALSFVPNYPEAFTNRAFAYCASQRIDEAKKDIAALKKLGAWADPRLIELTAPRGK